MRTSRFVASVDEGAEKVLRRLSIHLQSAHEPTVVIAGDLIVAERALAPITDDPFVGTALLVRPSSSAGNVRVRHHLVTSAGSQFHQVSAPDHVGVGALVISPNDAVVAASLVSGLANAVESGSISSNGSDVVELVAVALTRGGVSVKAISMVDVPWFRSPADADADAAVRAASSASDERISQLQANRVDDGFYSTFVVRKASKPLTRLALRLGWSPNSVTLVSFAIGILAAAAFAIGERWALLLGAVLLQASLIVDCVDGEVARATRRFSALGAWLDASTDRVKEFLAYAGLAIGAARFGLDIWWIAVVLVVLQTTRHMTDYDFSRIQRLREAAVPLRDIRLADDGGGASGWSVGAAMEMSSRMNRRDAVRWAKRAIHMPIGERWLVISVLAAILGPQWALGVLLVLGLVALSYVTLGRTLRTLSWRGPTPDPGGRLLARQADSIVGAVLRRRGAWTSRWAWSVPALLRLGELGFVAACSLALDRGALVVTFWWVAVVAFHHYDVLYRALGGTGTPLWITLLGGGWDGRTVLVAALVAAGVLGAGLAIGVVWLAAVFVLLASVQWLLVQQGSRT